MTALMGPSGSGKTTLLDVVSGRKNTGKIEGEVLFGGARAPLGSLKDAIGYVEQFDTLIGELTVRDMLMYTAQLRLPVSMSMEDKTARVTEVLDRLALNKCAGTVIGSVLKRGISGGQAKRVNIALSLISRPGLLFLDEPTSGLDSFMANEVATCLADLAREGRTVVCTIHSPTAKAFSLFDELLMLKSGRTVYNGPTEGAVPFLETVAGLSCPSDGRFFSLPEWLVDVTADAQPTEVRLGHSKSGTALEDMSGTVSKAERLDFAALYANSDLCKQRLITAAKVKADAKVGHFFVFFSGGETRDGRLLWGERRTGGSHGVKRGTGGSYGVRGRTRKLLWGERRDRRLLRFGAVAWLSSPCVDLGWPSLTPLAITATSDTLPAAAPHHPPRPRALVRSRPSSRLSSPASLAPHGSSSRCCATAW